MLHDYTTSHDMFLLSPCQHSNMTITIEQESTDKLVAVRLYLGSVVLLAKHWGQHANMLTVLTPTC